MGRPSKVGVAVVGYGYWGPNLVRCLADAPSSILRCVCDVSKESLALVHRRNPAVEVTSDYAEVLRREDVDAVAVATPASTHFALAAAAIEAGKHVLVEKPLCTRLEDAQKLVELAEQGRVVLMVGHTFLFNAALRKVKEWTLRPVFGQSYYLNATRTNLGPVRKDVNAIWDLAPHDVYIFNYLLDAQPEWVSAVGACFLGSKQEDVGFITLRYPGNVTGNIHVSWADPNKVREVAIVSSNMRIVFNDLDNIEPVRVFARGIAVQGDDIQDFGQFRLSVREGDIISPRITPSEPLKEQCNHFLDCILNHRTPLSDGRNGLAVVRVMQAVDQSLRENGRPIAV